jgi:hypothetical protein
MIRKQMLAALTAVILGAGVAASAAESSWALSGSLRVRQEYLDGQFRPGYDETDDQLAVRGTLRAEWRWANLAASGIFGAVGRANLQALGLRAEVNAAWLRRGRLLRQAPNASPQGDTHYIAVSLTYGF